MLRRTFFQSLLLFKFFPLDSSVFSILQILGNFLRSIPGEDGSSSPIHYTSVFSHAGLDLFPNCMLSLLSLSGTKSPMRNVQNRGFKHWCARSWFSRSRIVDEHRVIIHGSDLVELFGLITCVEGGLGQVAKLIVLVWSAQTCTFWSGKFGRIACTETSVRSSRS